MLKRVRFRFRHDDCWLQETTERHETVTLVVSSIYMVEGEVHVDLMVHAPEKELVGALVDEWEDDGRVHDLNRLYDGPKGTRFHAAYTSEFSIYPHIIHHTPLSIGTVRVAQGTEHYDILGEAGDVQELLEVLGEEGVTEIESARTLDEVPDSEAERERPELQEHLTDRQLQALVLAFSEGYYGWPRDLSASDLAEGMDLSVSTFLEHLREAESRVLSAAVEEFREEAPARFSAIREELRKRGDG